MKLLDIFRRHDKEMDAICRDWEASQKRQIAVNKMLREILDMTKESEKRVKKAVERLKGG